MAPDFNERSYDAVLSKILANQEEMRRMLEANFHRSELADSRIRDLEHEKWYVRGVTATIGLLAPGAWEWLKSK